MLHETYIISVLPVFIVMTSQNVDKTGAIVNSVLEKYLIYPLKYYKISLLMKHELRRSLIYLKHLTSLHKRNQQSCYYFFKHSLSIELMLPSVIFKIFYRKSELILFQLIDNFIVSESYYGYMFITFTVLLIRWLF